MNINVIKSKLPLIICALSLLALFFTFATVSTSVSVEGYGEGASAGFSVSGWTAAFSSFFGWLIPATSVALLAVTFLEPLQEYRKLGELVLPAVSFVVCLIVRFSSGIVARAGDVSGSVNIETTVSAGFGFYILILCDLVLLFLGIKKHILNKE